MSSNLGFVILFLTVSLSVVVKSQQEYCSNPNAVSIKHDIKSKLVLFGANVELTCCLPGGSTSLEWYLPDGRPVANYFLTPNVGPIYAIPDMAETMGRREVLHLSIKGFNKSNDGSYTCRDTRNKHVKPARTELTGRYRIVIDSPKEQFLENRLPGKIRCHVRGHAKINVNWFFQAKHIATTSDGSRSQDGRFSFLRDNQELDIRQVNPQYAGHYMCKAEVDGDWPGSAAFIELQPIIVQIFSTPVIESSSPRLIGQPYATESGVMELGCSATGRPSLEIVWYKDQNRRIYADNKKVFISETFGTHTAYSSLKIVNVDSQDIGNYTCKAIVNIPAANITRTASRSITPDIMLKPRFKSDTVLKATGDVGDSISLRCRVLGARPDKLRVRFLHNNRTVQPVGRFRLLVTTDPGNPFITDIKLSITNLQPKDGGTYTCRADTKLATVERSDTVKVWYAPQVTTANPQVYGLPHFRNILSCSARGLPKPTWFWTQNNRAVVSDNFKYYIRTGQQGDQSTSELVVLPSYWNTGVFGSYECRAVNRLGESAAVVKFTQAWRPDIPLVSACVVRQRVVILCIQKPNNTGGLQLSHYQVRIQPKPGNQFYGPFAYPIASRIELPNLIPGKLYRFALSAVSPAGRSSNAIAEAHTLPLSTPVIQLLHSPANTESDAYNVRWKVQNAGGFPIDHYKIKIRPVEVFANGETRGLGNWRNYFGASKGTKNRFRVNSLTPETAYEIVLSIGTGMGRSLEKHIVFRTRNQQGFAMPVRSSASGTRAGSAGLTVGLTLAALWSLAGF